MARRGQQVVAGDRLPDRIGIGVLAKVFPPELVDRVVDESGVREQRKRTLPARVVVYLRRASHLVPCRPARRYERKTKRPGGRYKTRKHGEATRLTPLTKVVFWLMPVPA